MQLTLTTPQQTFLQTLLTEYVNQHNAYQATANQSMTQDTLTQYDSDLTNASAILTALGGADTPPALTGDASEDAQAIDESSVQPAE